MSAAKKVAARVPEGFNTTQRMSALPIRMVFAILGLHLVELALELLLVALGLQARRALVELFDLLLELPGLPP